MMSGSRFVVDLVRVQFVAVCVSVPFCALAEGNLANGRTLSQAQCAHCHGQDGNARSTSFQVVPMLAGQPAGYLIQEMKNYAEGMRADTSKDGAMTKKLQSLSEQDFEDIAVFYATQKRY